MRLIDVDALIADLEYDVELDARALDCLDNESRRDIIQFDKDCKQNAIDLLRKAPTAQPETATVTIARTKGGVTMWYECDACGEPIDKKDCYCRNCGRKLTLPESYRGGGKE